MSNIIDSRAEEIMIGNYKKRQSMEVNTVMLFFGLLLRYHFGASALLMVAKKCFSATKRQGRVEYDLQSKGSTVDMSCGLGNYYTNAVRILRLFSKDERTKGRMDEKTLPYYIHTLFTRSRVHLFTCATSLPYYIHTDKNNIDSNSQTPALSLPYYIHTDKNNIDSSSQKTGTSLPYYIHTDKNSISRSSQKTGTSLPYYIYTLSTCSPVHPFTCLPVHPFTCLPVHLFTRSLVHLFTCSPVYLSTSLSVLHDFGLITIDRAGSDYISYSVWARDRYRTVTTLNLEGIENEYSNKANRSTSSNKKNKKSIEKNKNEQYRRHVGVTYRSAEIIN